ncbi:hypothetical protein PspTeo4_37936 [Pseudomonas sp. Teo4]|nr:hypothetical protein [Pseudomonas sp. Teo4]
MRIWRGSIQWQLIASMGAALLASILVVVAIYTVALNRLTERYLVDTALPASIEAIRNDIERMLGQPLTAAADIAGNTLLRDWLAAGENPAEACRASSSTLRLPSSATAPSPPCSPQPKPATTTTRRAWTALLAATIRRTSGSTATSTAAPSA